jgi:hypothetical protein
MLISGELIRIIPNGELLHMFNGWALQSVFNLTIDNITEDTYDLCSDAVSIADYMQLLQRNLKYHTGILQERPDENNGKC